MRNKLKRLNGRERSEAWRWLYRHVKYLAKNNTKPRGYQYDSSIAKCRIINKVLDQNRWARSIEGYIGNLAKELYPFQLWRITQWTQGLEHQWDWDNMPFPKEVIAHTRRDYWHHKPDFLTEKILKKYQPKRKAFKLRR